jgi:hypothetical protein
MLRITAGGEGRGGAAGGGEGGLGEVEEETAGRREEAARLREHEAYQRSLHERIFGPEEDEEGGGEGEGEAGRRRGIDRDRSETLKSFGSRTFTFLVARLDDDEEREDGGAPSAAAELGDDSVRRRRVVAVEVPLREAAEAFETVYVAASRHGCRSLSLLAEDDGDDHRCGGSGGYSLGSVLHVSRMVRGEAGVEDTPDDFAVDCFRLCHYLQGPERWTDRYAEMLAESVDAGNCLGMLELSEQLRLPRLWERSLRELLRAMDRLAGSQGGFGAGVGGGDGGDHDHFAPELRSRVEAIQAAIRSSIHGSVGPAPSPSRARPLGSAASAAAATTPSAPTASRLFFSSVEEYIAIFAERVQYYRERLAAAKEQQCELLEERWRRGGGGSLGGAREAAGRYASTPAHRLGGRGGASDPYLEDLGAKIRRQEARVRTLEIALREHKKLLLGGSP